MERATETLDKVHIAVWRRAQEAAKTVAVIRGKGSPRKDDKDAQITVAAKKKPIRSNSPCYSLGKAPERLASNLAVQLKIITKSDNQLYRHIFLKRNSG